MAEIINGREIVKRGFQKAFCDVCNRITEWYKEAGSAPAHCTDHSAWKAGAKRVDVSKAIATLAQLVPVVEAPQEWEVRRMNRMLRSADSVKSRGASLAGHDWASDIFSDLPEQQPLRPGQVYCTFCKKPTDQVNLTTERKPKITKTEVMDRIGDEFTMRERVMVKVTEIHACPDCVVNVRNPIVVRTV